MNKKIRHTILYCLSLCCLFFVVFPTFVHAETCVCTTDGGDEYGVPSLLGENCSNEAITLMTEEERTALFGSVVGSITSCRFEECYNSIGCDEGLTCSEPADVGVCSEPSSGSGEDDETLEPDDSGDSADTASGGRPGSSGGGLVISCALEGTCSDVSALLVQAIVIAEFLLGLTGTIALIMFVIGGVQYVTSFGSADKVKKGQQTLIGAVLGLVITFSAYLLIQFVIEALGVSSYFS